MWLVRELVRLVERIVLGFLIALVLAAIWAAVSKHSFTHNLYVTTLSLGCVLLLMGAVGRGSNFDRGMDYSVTQAAWGRIPGVSTLERRGEDPTLRPGIVFVLSGLALLAFAFFVVQ
ncbi:MAG TPA: hypothetical protein VKI43_17970 [Vicinamibacterales bacterium]|nr:hypothetical protein [Vicinamibacterales bacterium]